MTESGQYSRFPPITPEQRALARQGKLVTFTPEQEAYWRKSVEEAEREKPEIIARCRREAAARKEPTVSGAIRAAIHRSQKSRNALAEKVGIPFDSLREFLEGVAPLPSDALDRLAQEVGVQVTTPAPAPERASV